MPGLARTLPIRQAQLPDSDVATTGQQGMSALLWLSGVVMFVLSGFELGIVLQGQQHANLTTQQIALMFVECSLVMLVINAVLFFTSLLDKVPARVVIAFGLLIGMAGLAVMALHRTDSWMYLGVSLTSAGTGLVLPVITFLAAGAAHQKLGATMGGLAAAAGFGQTLGSAAGGWLFGSLAQRSFGWLALPLVITLFMLLARPRWCARQPARGGNGA
ncbi:MFS transporter [Polaromonas sp.]|uniref:MFS transporter n=1 Tax=Polaromonas sp. TaxID=1869339 RepID=UPI0025D3C822|nr:MFS transporter [Polaromonas sp.]